jgi:predicted SnoaL-like aldol condensation-catalyzing enzyme
MTNKQIVTDFLQLVTTDRTAEAYEKYINMDGKHHNTFNLPGFPALQKAMLQNDAVAPTKQFTIKHILEDGDLVTTHAHLVFNPGEPGMVVFHMFRLSDDKIVEMRDCGQPIPADSPNTDGAF